MKMKTRIWACIAVLTLMLASVVPAETADGVFEDWVARYNGPGDGPNKAEAIALAGQANDKAASIV